MTYHYTLLKQIEQLKMLPRKFDPDSRCARLDQKKMSNLPVDCSLHPQYLSSLNEY